MPQVTFNLTEAEYKAINWSVVSIEEYVRSKALKCVRRIVTQFSNYQPNKLSTAEREQIVLDTPLQTAAERRAAFEAETS